MKPKRNRATFSVECAADNCQEKTTQRVDHANEGKRPTCSIACRHRVTYGDRYDPANLDKSKSYRSRCVKYGGIYEPGHTRESTLALHGLACHWCGIECRPEDFAMVESKRSGRPVPLYGPKYPSLEHVEPLSRGGSHTPSNLRIACISCNVKRGTRTDWPSFEEIEADYGPDSPDWTPERFDEWREHLQS